MTAAKRGRRLGVRKCGECGNMHKPGRYDCEEYTCLPMGCPGCQTYASLNMVRLRAKHGIYVRATCKHCDVVYHWRNVHEEELGGTL